MLTFAPNPGLESEGRVASIGAGSGSEFFVRPGKGANGNRVEVAQRVAARIVIDEKSPRQPIAGLSSNVSVCIGK